MKKWNMIAFASLTALWPTAHTAHATLVTLTDWTDTTINTYFQSGQTFTANSAQSTSSGDPLLNNRLVTSPTGAGGAEVSTTAAGFFQDPLEAPLLQYGPGTYAVDLAAWSGSSSSTTNRVITTLGLFKSNTAPESTISLSLSNPNLVLGAMVENRQRGGDDKLTVFYRDSLGVLQSVSITTNQSSTLNADPNILQFRLGSTDRINSTPYTLRLDITNDTLRVRLLQGGLTGTVLANFDTGLLNIEDRSWGYLGFKVQALTQASSQLSRQAFDNFYVNADAVIPEPSTIFLLMNAGGILWWWRRRGRE